LNSKLHAVCHGKGRPLILLLSEGQISDFGGAALLIDAFPKAQTLVSMLLRSLNVQYWAQSGTA
jgi:hypothetical protein